MKIGSKVLCINDCNWTKEDFLHFHSLPVRGHVYVVRSVFHNDPDPFRSSPLTLVGIKGEMILVKDDHKNLVYREAHFSGDRFVEILSRVIFPEVYPGVFNFNNDEIQIKYYTPDVDLDYPSYYELLDECFDELGCTAYRYCTRDYNTFFDIFFAENPEETVDAFHQYILDELNAH